MKNNATIIKLTVPTPPPLFYFNRMSLTMEIIATQYARSISSSKSLVLFEKDWLKAQIRNYAPHESLERVDALTQYWSRRVAIEIFTSTPGGIHCPIYIFGTMEERQRELRRVVHEEFEWMGEHLPNIEEQEMERTRLNNWLRGLSIGYKEDYDNLVASMDAWVHSESSKDALHCLSTLMLMESSRFLNISYDPELILEIEKCRCKQPNAVRNARGVRQRQKRKTRRQRRREKKAELYWANLPRMIQLWSSTFQIPELGEALLSCLGFSGRMRGLMEDLPRQILGQDNNRVWEQYLIPAEPPFWLIANFPELDPDERQQVREAMAALENWWNNMDDEEPAVDEMDIREIVTIGDHRGSG